MRSYEQLLEEIKFRKEHGLPRIELTREERVAAFGDTRTPPDYEDNRFCSTQYQQIQGE